MSNFGEMFDIDLGDILQDSKNEEERVNPEKDLEVEEVYDKDLESYFKPGLGPGSLREERNRHIELTRHRIIPVFGFYQPELISISTTPPDKMTLKEYEAKVLSGVKFGYWLFDTTNFALSTGGDENLTAQLFTLLTKRISRLLRENSMTELVSRRYNDGDFELVFESIDEKKFYTLRCNIADPTGRIRNQLIRDIIVVLGNQFIKSNKTNAINEQRAKAIQAMAVKFLPKTTTEQKSLESWKYSNSWKDPRIVGKIVDTEDKLSQEYKDSDLELNIKVFENILKSLLKEFVLTNGITFDDFEAIFGNIYDPKETGNKEYLYPYIRFASALANIVASRKGGDSSYTGILAATHNKTQKDASTEVSVFVPMPAISKIEHFKALLDKNSKGHDFVLNEILRTAFKVFGKIHNGEYDAEIKTGTRGMLAKYFASNLGIDEKNKDVLLEPKQKMGPYDDKSLMLKKSLDITDIKRLTKIYLESSDEDRITMFKDMFERSRTWLEYLLMIVGQMQNKGILKQSNINPKGDITQLESIFENLPDLYIEFLDHPNTPPGTIKQIKNKRDEMSRDNILFGLRPSHLYAVKALFDKGIKTYLKSDIYGGLIPLTASAPKGIDKYLSKLVKEKTVEGPVKGKKLHPTNLAPQLVSKLDEILGKLNSGEELKNRLENYFKVDIDQIIGEFETLSKLPTKDEKTSNRIKQLQDIAKVWRRENEAINILESFYKLIGSTAFSEEFGIMPNKDNLKRWKKVILEYIQLGGSLKSTYTGTKFGLNSKFTKFAQSEKIFKELYCIKTPKAMKAVDNIFKALSLIGMQMKIEYNKEQYKDIIEVANLLDKMGLIREANFLDGLLHYDYSKSKNR